ncbi:glycosyltransferase family 2 protein [Mesorhizobium sp. RP14(2022)]|uniref:Glycosyltransferase family 2 protein n=1 Tax=Mesorhizobium liriopis TaxID=2953882 RepID=A0ABT1C666_9HYPH|nr:glycosyltransferase family A protein [Mesorhizobium liriopis]MCO6050158.1 glycosyltransferase family 2 protein [Mesorhizobium liriopis]
MYEKDIQLGGRSISVITRTLGHEPFLRRCGSSIEAASGGFEITWLIVNDAEVSMDEPLQRFCELTARKGRLRPQLIHSHAGHRALAANEGLKAATGEYIHIHDDDDTIHPDFYRITTETLLRTPKVGAVATRCERILEKPSSHSSGYSAMSRSLHYPEVAAISLASQAVNQTLPPISILFRRKALESVGMFDAELEVFEDYEFLLRFLSQYDIKLLDQVLARFHQREDGSSVHGNSRSTTNFDEENAFFRNTMLRRDIDKGLIGTGWLLAFGELMRGSVKTERILSQFYKSRLTKHIFSKIRRL